MDDRDIVERLTDEHVAASRTEAAAEITRLRAKVATLAAQLATARADALEEAAEVLGTADDALTEAEAILGGEYGDHYGPLCETMLKLRSQIKSLLDKMEQHK